MNLSKKIDVASKSSLVSLRAELARKHEEVAKAKSQSQAQFIRPIPKPKKETILTKKNTGVDERIEKDVIELKEDEDIHKKSRAALENKAKLYDKLSQNSSLVDEDDDVTSRYLVDFQQKSDDNKPLIITPASSTVANVIESDDDDAPRDSDDYDAPSDPEEDWVDYTDCLGRTRRCLRRDLKYIKEKDVTLSESLGYIDDRRGTLSDPATTTPTTTTTPADPELLSADMRQELIRQKWETQEEELKDKSDIHYQDVLFDEARSHGVGYYGFSADEQKRRAQQEALSKLRDETQKQQASAESLKERRQQQLKARLKAAKQRKRARMGLPPEEDSEPEEESSKAMEEEKKAAEERKAEAQRKAEEEKDNLDRAKKRQYVRPWDVGKDGVTAAKETEVLSQEDWVKKRRTVRDEEFAPPSSYQDDLRLSQSRKLRRSKPEEKSRKKVFAPIRNEVFESSSESDVTDDDDERSSSPSPGPGPSRGRGAEIAPPPTFDYCGPSSVAVGRSKKEAGKPTGDVENAISAGLKFLRHQFEEKQKKQKEKGLLDII